MNTLLTAFGLAFITVCNLLIMYGLGHLLTDVVRPIVNRKPFNCRECLTFWLTLLGGLAVALFSRRYFDLKITKNVATYALIGIAWLCAFINYLYIKSKFKIYE